MLLFTPVETENLRMKNRLVRSATAESMATKEGFVTDEMVELYKKLAEGGAGTVITGYMFVSEEGRASYKMTGISEDRHVDGLKKLVSTVKKADRSVVFVAQLAHAGRQTFISPVAPSAVKDPFTGIEPREMTGEDIERVIDDFVNAALRAEKAGFDAVQLHAAHGYLLSEFISPHTNRRKDEYGRERAKILLDIFEGIRGKSRIPVMIKMNACDFVPGGLEVGEAVRIAKLLDDIGFEAIEVSGGMYESIYHQRYNVVSQKVGKSGEAYFRDYAFRIKEAVNIPVMVVGGVRSLDVAESLLEKVEFVSMSRPLIRDPFLPRKMMAGEADRSDCKSCNLCLTAIFEGKPLGCYSKN
ncbi:NADH:flavin oxidoreductase [Archaeoglobus neptunius]|uniref:NADH:flavin oxidoreductase n=1 Tax=Archaeoglobus neptunius TaxID=2798580 RepID=UPI0019269F6F|nr:NADH:flavin oxidoreductase [Archaeoglobus neptunius]